MIFNNFKFKPIIYFNSYIKFRIEFKFNKNTKNRKVSKFEICVLRISVQKNDLPQLFSSK